MEVRTFPPEVFARLAPDVYFKRFWEQGERPTGRSKDEWRPVVIQKGGQELGGCLGSSVCRAGNATVLCGITGAVTSFEGAGGIYANVDIRRGGRAGPPTIEEQCLSYTAHRLIESAKFDRSNFVLSPESQQELVLNANVSILSRTGPSMDLVWEAIVAALADVRLPEFEKDERTGDMVPTGAMSDRHLTFPPDFVLHHRSLGIYNGEVLVDIDGPTEEQCIPDRISVATTDQTNVLGGFTLASAEPVSLDTIKKALQLAAAVPSPQ